MLKKMLNTLFGSRNDRLLNEYSKKATLINQLESKVKKLNSENSRLLVWFGLALPTICFIIWVNIPVIKIDKNNRREKFFISLYDFILFFNK